MAHIAVAVAVAEIETAPEVGYEVCEAVVPRLATY